jgi:hypothetical protein
MMMTRWHVARQSQINRKIDRNHRNSSFFSNICDFVITLRKMNNSRSNNGNNRGHNGRRAGGRGRGSGGRGRGGGRGRALPLPLRRVDTNAALTALAAVATTTTATTTTTTATTSSSTRDDDDPLHEEDLFEWQSRIEYPTPASCIDCCLG